jgi:N4-(beta-N-acetylglucosaminyl)-L-asparaginase
MPGGPNNHDTIGMMAIDANGNMGGACTTSGLAYKMHGRVGDSPIIGAGLYVDNEVGAATSSGVGEEVIRIVGSHLVVELMRHGMSPELACKEAVTRIVKRSSERSKNIQVGFVALNKKENTVVIVAKGIFLLCKKQHRREGISLLKAIIEKQHQTRTINNPTITVYDKTHNRELTTY